MRASSRSCCAPICSPRCCHRRPTRKPSAISCRARDDARVDLHARAPCVSGNCSSVAVCSITAAIGLSVTANGSISCAWPHVAEQHVVTDYRFGDRAARGAPGGYRSRLVSTLARRRRMPPPSAALRCFRGIDTVTAITLLAELHDVRRFPHPRALMAFIGLVPSEDSTGDRRRPRAITKRATASRDASSSKPPGTITTSRASGAPLRRRRLGSPRLIAIADKAQQRLCRRYRRLCARLKTETGDRHRDRARAGRLPVGGVAIAGGADATP